MTAMCLQKQSVQSVNVQGNILTRIQTKLMEIRLRLILLFLMFGTGAVPSFAQVELTVDTDALFTQANTWIGVFDDVYAIGIGISIAIAVLSLIGYLIVKALKSAGKG